MAVGRLSGCGSEYAKQADNGYCNIWLAISAGEDLTDNSLKMTGITMAWTFCALGLLAYREKSAMFKPNVA
jgi:hypothetical protein